MLAPQEHQEQIETQDGDQGSTTDVTLPDGGDRIAEKYIIGRRLGEGGMGVVYEAVHLRLRQPVALKFLHPDALDSVESCARFEREARAAGQLRGPHVARVLDVDTNADGLPYIVMELLRGRDLEAEMQSRTAPIGISEAVDWILEACAAMEEAHALGIVHRDLKPSNLFLHEEEDGSRIIKVLDFGISKILVDKNQPAVTSTCVSLGTPLYMSPEQVRSAKYVDGRADVWSMAIILYELLAGQPPFMGTATAAIAAIVADDTPRLRASRPDVPPELEAVIFHALEKDPDDRYSDVAAFAAALEPFGSSGASIAVSTPRLTDLAGDDLASADATGPRSGPRLAVASTTAVAAAKRMFTGPLARFYVQLPRARWAAAVALALVMVPVLTWALTDRTQQAPALLSAVETPHADSEDCPALPNTPVRGRVDGVGAMADTRAAARSAAHRERPGERPQLAYPAAVAPAAGAATADAPLDPARTRRAAPVRDAHDNPLYL